MRSNRQPLVQLCGKLLRERKVCTSDILAFASSHDQPRSGPNNSERESTSGRSTNYGSGHLIRVFRDIGRIFSLLFLLSHPSPVGQPLRGKGSRNMVSSKAKNGFNCVSCGTHRAVDEPAACHSPKREPRPGTAAAQGRGLGNPSGECFAVWEKRNDWKLGCRFEDQWAGHWKKYIAKFSGGSPSRARRRCLPWSSL
jgi:hypothetical protein